MVPLLKRVFMSVSPGRCTRRFKSDFVKASDGRSMYTKLRDIALKSGETVECGLVSTPEEAWAGRLEALLVHKGGIWNWQNSEVLRTQTGLDGRYYLLHRGGVPFANVCIFGLAGVGILGHVWTKPEERRKGASDLLMKVAMGDFAARGGKALFLGTDAGSVAHGIYLQHGFADVDTAGHMVWYADGRAAFEKAWFAAGPAEVERLTWRHWPAAAPLFLQPGPGVVRCAPLRMFWQDLVEGPLLPAIQAEGKRAAESQAPAAVVLRAASTQAVLGLALWQWDPVWPETCMVDVFCHATQWGRAGELLAGLTLPPCRRRVAFGDATCPAKQAALEAAGYARIAAFQNGIAAGRGCADGVTIVQMEK